MGGFVAGGYIEVYEAEDVLRAAAEVCGLPDGEAGDVIRWGLHNGAKKPLELTSGKLNEFGAKPSFGANGSAPNFPRQGQARPYLGQLGSERRGLPKLGGKPCL